MMLKLPLLFSSHAVLQRDRLIPVWGSAQAGATVSVTLQGKTSTAVADRDGAWQTMCGPFSVSQEEVLEIEAIGECLRISDIQIGEVWLAGGQSNMEFLMAYDADWEQEKRICSNPDIRFFDYPKISYPGQLQKADYMENYGFWRRCDGKELAWFSAVGYYFAKDLYARYGVPVGIIGCNWGGSPASAWMPVDAVLAGGGKAWLDDYEQNTADVVEEEYNNAFDSDFNNYKTSLLDDIFYDMMMRGFTIPQMERRLREIGLDPSGIVNPSSPMGPRHPWRPCGLYESMLKEVAPYGIRGVIWYQGESDAEKAELYKTLFPSLIQSWRRLWNADLPFLFVQLAPMEQWMDSSGSRYPQIRAAQQYVADTVPGTGMAVITDAGMQYDIHPKKKRPAGQRLALLAACKVYGDDLLCEAPTLIRVSVEDGKLTLTFSNTGQGLHFADNTRQRVSSLNRFDGFQIIQEGRELAATQLTAQARNNHLFITGPEIKGGASVTVKVAETPWCHVKLYNSADIPVRPGHCSSETVADDTIS